MINNKKKNNKKIVIGLFILFLVLLGTTLFVSFSSNLDEQEVIVKSITPVYDESSTVVVDNENVIFNDKNQVVDYKVVIENTQEYPLQMRDITSSTPTEEFLKYEVEGIEEYDVLEPNSTKELTISFETMGIKGWGRNFADELITNVNFSKEIIAQEENPSTEDDDKGDENPENENSTDGQNPGGNNSADGTGKNPSNGEMSKPSGDGTPSVNSPSTNNKDDSSKEDEDEHIENPYTSDKGLLVVLVIATGVTGLAIIVVSKNKFAKYTIFIIALSSTLTLVNAEEVKDVDIKVYVRFESQNVMKTSGFEIYDDGMGMTAEDYWLYASQIIEFYIQNEIVEIDEYAYEFDVSKEQNSRVKAYLVERDEVSICYDFDSYSTPCYDMYLQADGIIYPNEDASYYFAYMTKLESIGNLEGFDTSNVTDMSGMFRDTGYNSEHFTLDLSNFDTSNVTDMSRMFHSTGSGNPNFTLDVSNFDTSNVTDMSYMFDGAGLNSENFTLNLGDKFDTSKVTDMSSMFSGTGSESENFTLDVSNFDTSNVENMSEMFRYTGYESENFTLDVSNFDTSKVTDMSLMFLGTGYSSETFTLDVSNFDTSNVTNMWGMFEETGYNSKTFTLDLSNFDTSKVTDMSEMFAYLGYNNLTFTLDVSNFDTSKVKYMGSMFEKTGYNSEAFTLDVSNFDMSKVVDMSDMFSKTGKSSANFVTSITIRTAADIEVCEEWDDEEGGTYTECRYQDLDYSGMFYETGGKMTVNYTEEASEIIDSIISTAKTCVLQECYTEETDEGDFKEYCYCEEYIENTNVVKGELVD